MPVDSKTKKSVKKLAPKFGKNFISVEDSTLVEKVFYDPDTKTLDAVFRRNGTRYRYYKVGAKRFCEFVLAKSMGKYFNEKIRSSYNYERI